MPLAITQAQLKKLVSYDSETGLFVWLPMDRSEFRTDSAWRGRNTRCAGLPAGSRRTDDYVRIQLCGQQYMAHRLAWLYVYGSWPVNFIDHIDGNPNNNRISNLRDVTTIVNGQNQRRAQAHNKTTGLLGATYDKVARKYKAIITFEGKTKFIGHYKTAMEAHTAYVEAKRRLHEGCAI
jgi:hypothetical protein